MRNIETRFPNEVDQRIFYQDISINQVQTMTNYYTFLNAKNYDMASDLLNNSDVFFYGAWLLNMFENRLVAIGDYLIKEEEHNLITYNNLEPSQLVDTYEEMSWVSEEILNEFGMINMIDYVQVTDVNMYFGDTEPNATEVNDTWIENGETTTSSLSKDSLIIHYQNDEPTSNTMTVWISDM